MSATAAPTAREKALHQKALHQAGTALSGTSVMDIGHMQYSASSTTRCSPRGNVLGKKARVAPLVRADSDEIVVGYPVNGSAHKLEHKDVVLPSDSELLALSTKLNAWLETFRSEQYKPGATSWHQLFGELDSDHSGFVTFDELKTTIRRNLHKGASDIADDELKGLWYALDKDGSNSLDTEELAGFLKLGEKPRVNVGQMVYSEPAGRLVNDIENRHGMNRAIEGMTTAEMRKQLKKKGVPRPTDAELIAYSVKLNVWIEAFRHEARLPPAVTWFNLFQVLDEDGSDFVTFDEFVNFIRRELKKGPGAISHTELMALWVGLDKSGDNRIDRDEAACFFKLGQASAKAQRDSADAARQAGMHFTNGGTQPLTSTIERHGMDRPLDVKATKAMLHDLQMLGLHLLDDKELAHQARCMVRWIEKYRYGNQMKASVSWYNLFKEVDVDGSNYVTFDELTTFVWRVVKKGPNEISHDTLKALWCTLDKDCNDQLDREEMAKFFKLGEPTRKKIVGSWWNPFKSKGKGGENLFEASERSSA